MAVLLSTSNLQRPGNEGDMRSWALYHDTGCR